MSDAIETGYAISGKKESDSGYSFDFYPLKQALEEYLSGRNIEPDPQKLFTQLRSLDKEAQGQVIRRAKQLEPIMAVARAIQALNPPDRAEALEMAKKERANS